MSDETTAGGATAAKVNALGLTLHQYRGGKSTLCAGCGHDAISAAITQAYYELDMNPRQVAKMSGIGCSSKTPAYFLGEAFGFNSVHGRMPSVATGANLANRTLNLIGVSGDGDTASIGLGQFCHLLRRNVRMVYVVENNGVYGLTKGQFSATADRGSLQKKGEKNPYEAIDVCALAIQLGCDFVGRSFSGDRKQLIPMLQAAILHTGTALLDVISPCVTFNDHEGSTKSYDYARKNDWALHEIGFVPGAKNIEVEYDPGTTREVRMHDGSHVMLKKLGQDYDPTRRLNAFTALEQAKAEGKIVTGLLYVNPDSNSLADTLNMVDPPLSALAEKDLRPSRAALDEVMQELR